MTRNGTIKALFLSKKDQNFEIIPNLSGWTFAIDQKFRHHIFLVTCTRLHPALSVRPSVGWPVLSVAFLLFLSILILKVILGHLRV